MFSSKSIVWVLCLIFVGCYSPSVTICDQSNSSCHIYKKIFDSIGLKSEFKHTNVGLTLTVSKERENKALSVFTYLERIKHHKTKSSFKDIFIPKQNFSTNEELLKKLRRLNGVFALECTKLNLDTLIEKCEIYYVSSILSHENLVKKIEAEYMLKGLKFTYVDLLDDIHKEFGDAINIVPVNEKLIVLSPFSFHVPFVEKEIAGIQLILVLGLFLLSGFILGFWVSTRNLSKGKTE